MTMDIAELQAVQITVIVDNEVDPVSSYTNEGVTVSGRFSDVALSPDRNRVEGRGEARTEMRMADLCCGAHGLSYLITAHAMDGTSQTVLFDAGPEGWMWELNAARLKADIAPVEVVMLSHWHKDHSGGIVRAIELINEAKQKRRRAAEQAEGGDHGSSVAQALTSDSSLIVDLHPDRPPFRGMLVPEVKTVSLEADATFDEIAAAGATVHKTGEAHTILNGAFMVSGEIPRVTPYENGSKFVATFDATEGRWRDDALVMDERFLACRVRGKGLVVFTGCSHAGVVNVARHAVQLAPARTPLFAVMGGFHLVGVDEKVIAATVEDLARLDPKLLIAGHCSGWKVKVEIEKRMKGALCPSTVGTSFTI